MRFAPPPSPFTPFRQVFHTPVDLVGEEPKPLLRLVPFASNAGPTCSPKRWLGVINAAAERDSRHILLQ